MALTVCSLCYSVLDSLFYFLVRVLRLGNIDFGRIWRLAISLVASRRGW